MGRFLRFGLMGCGGLVLLVVLLGIVVAVLGGGGTETAGSDPGGPTAPEEPGEAENESADPVPAKEAAPAAQPASEEGNEEIIVRVTGDQGIRFTGDVGVLDSSRSVEGVTPQEFPVEVDQGFMSLDSVSAVAQNQGGSGNLVVQIVRGGEVVKESSTSAQYGVATANWSPSE